MMTWAMLNSFSFSAACLLTVRGSLVVVLLNAGFLDLVDCLAHGAGLVLGLELSQALGFSLSSCKLFVAGNLLEVGHGLHDGRANLSPCVGRVLLPILLALVELVFLVFLGLQILAQNG